MLSLLIGIQCTGIVLLFAELIYVLLRKNSRQKMLMLLVTVSTLINMIGYLFELRASNMEMAMQAVRFIYIGKPYIIFATFLFCLENYGIRLSQKVRSFLLGIHVMISVLVLTSDYNRLFYSSVSYTYDDMFPHVVLGYGIVYKLYNTLVMGYLVLMLLLGIYNMRHTKDRNEKIKSLYIIAIVMVSAVGMFIYYTGVTKGYDCTHLSYLIGNLLLLVCMVKYNILDTVTVVQEKITNELSDGLLVVDSRERVLYFNERMKWIFPELTMTNYTSALSILNEFIDIKENYIKDESIFEVDKKQVV